MNVLLKSALKYVEVMGWPVLPLNGKHPLTKHGSKDATTDVAELREWWNRWPRANIGLATAIKFWALDIDTKKAGDLSLEQLEAKYGKLPDTLQQITGTGGRHYLFLPPDFIVTNSESEIAPGVDVRGVGGYIVAAPSIHPLTGREYVWDGLAPIAEQKLLPAPKWLLDMLRAGANNRSSGAQPIPDRIPKGKQHSTLVSLAGSMRQRGLDFPEIFAALDVTNRERCTEPGPIENIRQIAESVCRYEKGKQPPSSKNGKPSTETIIETSASEVYAGNYADPEPIIDNLLFPGLTLFAGKSKLGKSWFAMQTAIAIASGQPLAEYLQVMKPGRVLYLSLEESPRQTKRRMRMLMPHANDFLNNIKMVYEIPPLLAGGAAILDKHLEEHPAEVVIIDSLLALVRQAGRGKSVDVMQADYNVTNTLRQIAEKHGITILLIAHTRKAPGDAIDTVQGTMGLVAATDAIWVLSRDSRGTFLTTTGREIYASIFGLSLVRDRGWKITGEGDEVEQGVERREILDLLRENGPMKLTSIARTVHKSVSTVHNLLGKLSESGLVIRSHYGTYRLTDQQDPS